MFNVFETVLVAVFVIVLVAELVTVLTVLVVGAGAGITGRPNNN